MANWLQFDKLKQWDYLVMPFFQYDDVPDAHIYEALQDPGLAHVDVQLDWEDDQWLSAAGHIPEARKHAYRVAALVQAFQSGQPMSAAIELDTFHVLRCGCSIGNGHHRIRALQYLGTDCGPFALSGRLTPLEELVAEAGCNPPEPFRAYFSPAVWLPSPEDVVACPGAVHDV
jgi:hypothetical protein